MAWAGKIGDWLSRVLLPSSARGRRVRFERRFREAQALYASGRYEDANNGLEEALLVAGEPDACKSDLAVALERIGEFQHSVGAYAKAEELIRRSLKIREELHGPDSPRLAGTLNDLALLHYAQGKYREGEILYRRLLPLLEAERGPADQEVAVCLDNYAAVLRKQKREEEAAQLQARASQIRKRLRGESPA